MAARALLYLVCHTRGKQDVNNGSSNRNSALWSPRDKMMHSPHTKTPSSTGKTGALAYSQQRTGL